MKAELKQMRLVFTIGKTTWNRRVETLDSEVIWQGVDEKIVDQGMTSDVELDAWVAQMMSLPMWNIVEHERIRT